MCKQIADDPELLKLMLEDAEKAPGIYRPTNYWSVHNSRILRELRKLGLHDFRRRRNSFLASFGALDLVSSRGRIDLFKNRIFNNRITRNIPLWPEFLSFQNAVLNKMLPASDTSRKMAADDTRASYRSVSAYGRDAGARPVEELTASLHGNPEDVIEIDGRAYTTSILYYYLRYAYCCRHIDFEKVGVLVELGSGAGKQVEVIKKLHPNTSFLLFDIPPQLYVCEQYLKSVFPDFVVSYRDTRNLDSIEAEKGKIFIFGNWKFPLIEKIRVDLFWNAASFQEMEPDVVLNYLRYMNEKADAVFLQETMQGKEVARKKGAHGVLKKTTLEDYKKGLKDFDLCDISRCLTPSGSLQNYSDSFWKRRKGSLQ